MSDLDGSITDLERAKQLEELTRQFIAGGMPPSDAVIAAESYMEARSGLYGENPITPPRTFTEEETQATAEGMRESWEVDEEPPQSSVATPDSGLFRMPGPGSSDPKSGQNTSQLFFIQGHDQHVVHYDNAYVVFGADHPEGMASGYGAENDPNCNTIDLVVGRGAGARKGKGLKPHSMVNNNITTDAARIYISQKTKIDTNFALADGSLGNVEDSSAIGIKADGIRIVGREGIKIVTGGGRGVRGGGETSSTGEALKTAPKIDLLAGNNDANLQPIVLGTRTANALYAYDDDIIKPIINALKTLGEIQSEFYGVLAESLGSIAPPVGAAVHLVVDIINRECTRPMGQAANNVGLWEANYLSPSGDSYIGSSNVRST